jgi:signal peptidase I
LVLFFTTYVAQATRVPSESMKPSILAEFWPLPDSTGLLFYDGR